MVKFHFGLGGNSKDDKAVDPAAQTGTGSAGLGGDDSVTLQDPAIEVTAAANPPAVEPVIETSADPAVENPFAADPGTSVEENPFADNSAVDTPVTASEADNSAVAPGIAVETKASEAIVSAPLASPDNPFGVTSQESAVEGTVPVMDGIEVLPESDKGSDNPFAADTGTVTPTPVVDETRINPFADTTSPDTISEIPSPKSEPVAQMKESAVTPKVEAVNPFGAMETSDQTPQPETVAVEKTAVVSGEETPSADISEAVPEVPVASVEENPFASESPPEPVPEKTPVVSEKKELDSMFNFDKGATDEPVVQKEITKSETESKTDSIFGNAQFDKVEKEIKPVSFGDDNGGGNSVGGDPVALLNKIKQEIKNFVDQHNQKVFDYEAEIKRLKNLISDEKNLLKTKKAKFKMMLEDIETLTDDFEDKGKSHENKPKHQPQKPHHGSKPKHSSQGKKESGKKEHNK